MGASRGYIVGIIEKEAILISVIGLIAGFVVSLVAGYLIHKTYGLVFEYSWRWALVAAAIGVVGGILGRCIRRGGLRISTRLTRSLTSKS